MVNPTSRQPGIHSNAGSRYSGTAIQQYNRQQVLEGGGPSICPAARAWSEGSTDDSIKCILLFESALCSGTAAPVQPAVQAPPVGPGGPERLDQQGVSIHDGQQEGSPAVLHTRDQQQYHHYQLLNVDNQGTLPHPNALPMTSPPTSSFASMSAPAASRACTTSRWPLWPAAMRGVLPICAYR